MTEMIEVLVTAEHRVFYKQRRKISKALFDKYEAMCDSGSEREIDREFESLIDTADVYDAYDLEDVTLEAFSSTTCAPSEIVEGSQS